MTALIDTSFLLATVAPQDRYHAVARTALANLAYPAVQLMRRIVTSSFEILDPTRADYLRGHDIMLAYEQAQFDFADALQMAMAERLDIRQVFTFDRRDFAQFRPHHCDYLDLLP